MIELVAGLTILVMFICWVTIVFNLPGNWLNLIILLIWKFTHAGEIISWWFLLAMAAIAGLGEILEFLSQMKGSQKFGGSSKGGWGALIGAILGAIFGAPFLFGIGALIGAVAGAFLGSLVFELLAGRNWKESIRASKGAMFGKVLGFIAKGALGMIIISLSIPRIWPG